MIVWLVLSIVRYSIQLFWIILAFLTQILTVFLYFILKLIFLFLELVFVSVSTGYNVDNAKPLLPVSRKDFVSQLDKAIIKFGIKN